jgi:hypothetical protein
MAEARFPGWGPYEQVFKAMARDTPNGHVHPASGVQLLPDGRIHLLLDPACRDRTGWFLAQLPDTSPQYTSQACLVMVKGIPAFINLKMFAGDVDATAGIVPERIAALSIPIAVLPRDNEALHRWCGRRMTLVFPSKRKEIQLEAILLCTRKELKKAQQHTASVQSGGLGHPDAVSDEEAMPLLGGIGAPAADDLAATYQEDRSAGIHAAAAALGTYSPSRVLEVFAGVATAQDLAAVAYSNAPDSTERTAELANAVTDPVLLLDTLIAYEETVHRRSRTDLVVHPKHLEALFSVRDVDTLATAWEAVGRNTQAVRTALRGMKDPAAYYRFLAAIADEEACARLVLSDGSLAQFARDVAAGHTDRRVFAVACRPDVAGDVGLDVLDVLDAVRVAHKQQLTEAATTMLDWGWDVEPVGRAVASGGRWKHLWSWLSDMAEGDALVSTARDCGIPADALLGLLDVKPRRALWRLREECGASDRTVAEIAEMAGVDGAPEPSPADAASPAPPPADEPPPPHAAPDGGAEDAELPVPETVAEAVSIAEGVCDRLVFLDEARSSAMTSDYRDPARLLADLLALNRLADAWASGSLGMDVRTAAPEFGLSCYRQGISRTAANQHTGDYRRTWRGRTVMLGPHLARGVGPSNLIMRVYWHADADEGVFVVGHVGAHLRDAGHRT